MHYQVRKGETSGARFGETYRRGCTQAAAGNNVAFALGLAQKAGKTASGDVAVRAALKSGKVKVLVLAQDAAPNSKKEIYFLAEMAGVQVIELLTRNELGYAIGKGPRIAVAITDANFANMLLKK